ncbi:hypothetical protein KBC31_00545 [Candidatus Saccharibacteria bacterium]|nr:hypothetical protein [Candidatus Saccharibacteria bacterium]
MANERTVALLAEEITGELIDGGWNTLYDNGGFLAENTGTDNETALVPFDDTKNVEPGDIVPVYLHELMKLRLPYSRDYQSEENYYRDLGNLTAAVAARLIAQRGLDDVENRAPHMSDDFVARSLPSPWEVLNG